MVLALFAQINDNNKKQTNMSDKIRVLFKVPNSHPGWSKLANPVEIPIEKYIEFKVQERDGSKEDMAEYVSAKFMKKQSVSSDEIEMLFLPDNPAYVIEINRQIEQGLNPLNYCMESNNDEDDDDYNDNDYVTSHKDNGQSEDGGKWDNKATTAVITLVVIIALIIIFFISLIN